MHEIDGKKGRRKEDPTAHHIFNLKGICLSHFGLKTQAEGWTRGYCCGQLGITGPRG